MITGSSENKQPGRQQRSAASSNATAGMSLPAVPVLQQGEAVDPVQMQEIAIERSGATVQRKPVEVQVTGLTHLVALMEGSLYRKNFLENEKNEVSDGDVVEIENTSRLNSRRGPNQENHADTDERGPQWYGWYHALKLNGEPIGPDFYIREDTIELSTEHHGADTEQIRDAETSAHEERAGGFRKPWMNSPIVPKDLSNQPKVAHMSFDHTDIPDAQKAAAGYIKKMARVALERNFEIHVACAQDGVDVLQELLGDDDLFNYIKTEIIPASAIETWAEDSGSFNIIGGVSVPAKVKRSDLNGHVLKLMEARARRYYPEEEVDTAVGKLARIEGDNNKEKELRRLLPKIDFSGVNKVAWEDNGKIKSGIAAGSGKALREDLTHQEGGNTLTGTLKNGQPYALVGKDSAELSRSILETELGRQVSDQELRFYFSMDLGMDSKAIFFVEQPGEFHLDMSMVLMGPGQVALNDPIEAVKMSEKWILEIYKQKQVPQKPGDEPVKPDIEVDLTDLFADTPVEIEEYNTKHAQWKLQRDAYALWEKEGKDIKEKVKDLNKEAMKEAEFIQMVLNDLRKAGLDVVLMPLVFNGPGIGQMNFANGEGGTDMNGKRFFITNGGIPQAQDFIRKIMAQAFRVEVEFVDLESSRQSLKMSGGMGCRVKFEGEPKLN